MALPTTNLQLDVIASVLGESTTNVVLSGMCMSSNVNEYGLDVIYCTGATPSDKLTNLQSTPYYQGKFRNYDHNAALPLNGFKARLNSSHTCPIDTSAEIWSSGTTIDNCYDNDYHIYADSSGSTYATNGWYATSIINNNYYVWSSTNDPPRWINSGVCSLSSFLAKGPRSTSTEACEESKYDDYWYYGSGSYPTYGDIIFTNSGGTTTASTGYYKMSEPNSTIGLDSYGVVIITASC